MLNNLLKGVPENVRIIIISSAPLAIVLLLFLIVGNFGIKKVNTIRTQVSDETASQRILAQKVNLLQTVSTSLGNSPDIATTALPGSNSALTVISQLKNLGFANSVLLTNIKSGSESKDASGLSKVDISFEISGTKEQVIAFVKSIPGIAPITLVDSVKLNESLGESRANIGVKSYWSVLPTSLPKVTQSLTDLTVDEKKILVTVGTLTQPVFLTLPAAGGSGKADPFSL